MHSRIDILASAVPIAAMFDNPAIPPPASARHREGPRYPALLADCPRIPSSVPRHAGSLSAPSRINHARFSIQRRPKAL